MAVMATGQSISAGAAEPEAIEIVPAEFIGDRVFATPTTADGTVLRFFTDTGGGWNAIAEDVAERLGLERADKANGSEQRFVEFPRFDGGKPIPRPPPYYADGNLVVVARSEIGADGFLGGRWHADRVWEFDYLAKRLKLHPPSRAPTLGVAGVPLGFQTNSAGDRTMHFARIEVSVAGESHDMLLDTGATAHLADDAGRRFGLDTGTEIGTSFVTKSLFEQWAKSNPGWTVLERGDRIQGHTFPMIEVPRLTIGEHTVGPVWFVQRPDAWFGEYMAQMMDMPIDGAIGGSALKYFRVVIDYANATAYFTTSGTETAQYSQGPLGRTGGRRGPVLYHAANASGDAAEQLIPSSSRWLSPELDASGHRSVEFQLSGSTWASLATA